MARMTGVHDRGYVIRIQGFMCHVPLFGTNPKVL
jgi:hypothetical protein